MSLRIKIIIGLMSIALLGLVWIQFYWIDNAIVLKKDEFNQKVSQAMRHVVRDIERHEAVQNIRRHRLGRQLIHEKMLHRKKLMMKRRREDLNRQMNNQANRNQSLDQSRGQWKITEQYNEDSSMHYIRREYVGIDSSSLLPGQEVEGEVLDDIIMELVDESPFRSIEQRVNAQLIDSLLRKQFNAFMIDTEVDFAVFDFFGRKVIQGGENTDLENVRESKYKARLFPNDFFGEPFFLSIYFPNQKTFLLKSMWITLSISTLFLLLIIGAFAYTIHVIQNQKQLSLIKNDFISNMTHELKTPISTISLACEALGDKDIAQNEERKGRFLQMINQENKRLGMLVENVLKSSIWDKSDFKLNIEEIDMHEIIQDIGESMEVITEQKGGKLTLNLLARKPVILGDKVHLSNILYNLIDNAIKYSPDKLDITINTSNNDKEVIVEVVDQGMGIPKEQQKKIFDKFYRVPQGNIHNVKGFGLGLNYVQNVIRNHGGDIIIKSNPGKGSIFQFNIPYNFNG